MFPSCGLFADITCPFSNRGLCQRPQCLYKHDFVAAWVASTSTSSSVDVETAADGSIQELQRLNKEIETVKQEVELEQRRLSHYQTSQGEGRNTPPTFSLSKFEGICNQDGRAIDGMASHSQMKKYVVDNSKPRTDLEYDPLSNFSAGLRFCGSSCKQLKPKRALEREGGSLCDQKVSPRLLDESTEDCMLIIDIPTSPVRKKPKYERLDDNAADFSQDPKSKPRLVPDSPQQAQDGMHQDKCEQSEENPDYDSAVEKTCKGFENAPTPVDRSVIDLTKGQSRDYQHVCEKEKTFESTLAPSQQSVIEEKAEPLLLSLSSDISISDDISPVTSASPSKQRDIQTSSTEMENDRLSSEIKTQSLVLDNQKMVSKSPATMDQTSLVINQQKQPCSDNSESQRTSSVYNSLANGAIPPESSQQPSKKESVIIISSSEEEELNYSDMDLSDSDPMEECYRIFMEANESVKEPEKESDESEITVSSNDLARKKWVAHEAKHTELPVQSRPEPQILVPLREPAAPGFGSQSSVMSKMHQVQQRASMLTASVKGGQAFVSITSQRKPETQTNAVHVTQTHANAQPLPVLNACANYLPLATTVIDVGNNLQLILPEGTFPVSSANSPVTSVLTPIGHMPQGNSLGVKQLCLRAAVTPVQRYHTTAPVLIPAQSLRPSPAAVATHLNPTASTTGQPVVQNVNVKPVSTKRKLKQSEPAKDKVPHDIRQRYVNMFTEEFLKTTPNVNDAFEKAVAEEKTVYNRSANKLKYLSVAVNSLKRLKNQTAASSRGEKAPSEKRKGKISLNLEMCRENSDIAFFESLKDYILPEEQLIENNYPVQHPEKPGSAVLFEDTNKGNTTPLKRTCCRCGATYSVSKSGKHVRKEECNYHYGRGVERKVPGGVETRYSCCQGVMGAPGCQVFQLHVHDSLSLDGFVSTRPRLPSDSSCPGVYSLDCAMCYTVSGLELSRVSVVNSSLQVVYDTFVRPDSDVIDYNSRFSGISEEDVKGNNTSLWEVQETLMSFINADTVLIGHGLETALCALKLLHGRVVDTSVVFPHRLGPPHKRTLNQLTAEHLRRIIQESVCGHDTAEDAAACMELMLWKAKEDGKLKK